MSYESGMLLSLNMPTRKEVEEALIISLFKNNGVIKDFSSDQKIVEEIAEYFRLNFQQRTAYLETIYKKENRLKKSSLWHRLLFRAADSLAKQGFVSRPTETFLLTNKKEWLLKEKGIDLALRLLNLRAYKKELLPTKSFEVLKIIKKLNKLERPPSYNPFDKEKRITKVTREIKVRARGFRLAVIEAYNYKCSICGMKIKSPDSILWEVEAAHIVPHKLKGKDDLWNGIALCHLHHWLFDVGWITIHEDYSVQVSSKINNFPNDFGKIGNYNFLKCLPAKTSKIFLPESKDIYPHKNSLSWHRDHIFHQ